MTRKRDYESGPNVPTNSSRPSKTGDEEAAFRAYLRNRGVKYTSARRHILQTVLEIDKHFEAEELLYMLRDRGLNVGMATVYRTLPLLVDCGILKQVRFDVKHAHYERVFGEEPHHHMVCRDCGRIIEFSSDAVLELGRRIGRQHDFQVTAHRFQLAGLCSECSSRS